MMDDRGLIFDTWHSWSDRSQPIRMRITHRSGVSVEGTGMSLFKLRGELLEELARKLGLA